MGEITDRYINPFTDFGFKKLFGEEPNKDLLIDFLNELLRDKQQVQDLTYLKNDHIGSVETDRTAVFDLYCQNKTGERFIIELQKVRQNYFMDRSIYYSTFAIQDQAIKGKEWDYRLQHVYTIGIMDFCFDETHPKKFNHEAKLMEIDLKEVLYDKLTFIYLEMPKFNKTEQELVTHFDKWLYLIKNLHTFQEIPEVLQEHIFRKTFEIAEVSKLNKEDMIKYQDSLKAYRDFNNSIKTAVNTAISDEKRKIAKAMKADNQSIELIMKYTGLSSEQIKNL